MFNFELKNTVCACFKNVKLKILATYINKYITVQMAPMTS